MGIRLSLTTSSLLLLTLVVIGLGQARRTVSNSGFVVRVIAVGRGGSDAARAMVVAARFAQQDYQAKVTS